MCPRLLSTQLELSTPIMINWWIFLNQWPKIPPPLRYAACRPKLASPFLGRKWLSWRPPWSKSYRLVTQNRFDNFNFRVVFLHNHLVQACKSKFFPYNSVRHFGIEWTCIRASCARTWPKPCYFDNHINKNRLNPRPIHTVFIFRKSMINSTLKIKIVNWRN